MFFTMLHVELVNLKTKSLVRLTKSVTYKSFSELWWEAHLITWFSLVVEVSAALQEREHGIKEAMDAITSLLAD